jgi:long-chain fatty acid transport protein
LATSRLWMVVGLVVWALALPSVVHASPLFELMGSSFGTGGFNGRSTGASAASTYFNPAFLPRAKQGLELGWYVVGDSISITLDPRARANDVPESSLDRTGLDLPPVPTTWLDDGCKAATGQCVTDISPQRRQSNGSGGKVYAYQALGLVNHLVDRYLSLGLYALIPLNTFTRARSFFVDEREQYFSNSLHPEMYGDRMTPVSLAFGAGSQITDWLAFGMSFTLSLSNEADAGAYVGNSAKVDQTLQLSTKVNVAASVSPHFGLLLEPIDDLDLSFTLHTPQKMEINTGFGIYLPNGDSQYALRPATHAWLPWTAGLGASYDVYRNARDAWSVTASTTFERWSEYLNRQTERPTRDYEWRDVFTGAVGVRYTRDTNLAALLDFTYRPTPVPLQTGRTNYVDNDRYGFVAGMQYELPVERWKVAFRFGGQAQVQVLPERHQTKFDPSAKEFAGKKYSQIVVDEWPDNTRDISTGEVISEARGLQTNNPGWPGFSSKGVISGGGLTLSLLY